MGTNYYVQTEPCANACEHCSMVMRVHLGKSSAGWKFLHRAYTGDEYETPEVITWAVRDRASWLKLLDLGDLFDEYGRDVSRDELLQLIENKQATAKMSHSDPRHMGPHWRPSADDFENDGYDFCAREFS